jgi:hypothetical protein
MLVDFGKLIHDQIPDKSGHTLPTNLASGAYRIRDLTDAAAGTVYEGKVIVDKTNGHAAYGCAICCGPKFPFMAIDPLPVPVSGFANQQVQAPNSCSAGMLNVTGDFPTWWTDNTSIATANGHQINGVAVGATNHHALSKLMYWGPREYADPCPQDQQQGDAGTCVSGLKFSGTANAFVFVGIDSHIVSANSYFLSGTPTGGTYGATSSDSSDILTPTFVSSLQLEKVTVQTADQSTTNGDRTLTFSYTPPWCQRFTLTQTVTARKFSYLTNNNPSNQCTLGFGTDQVYIYAIYTHPDKTAVDANSGLGGTPVTETFDQTPTCLSETGDGAINSDGQFIGQFTDHLAYCGNKPLTCSETRTQTLKVAGFAVRTNTLQTDSSGITYTNGGPNQ